MRKGGATLGATFGLEKQLMESIEGYNKMDEGTRKLHDENYAKVGSLLGAIQEAPPEQQAALWAQSFPELNRLEPGTFSPEFPGGDKLKGQTVVHGGLGAILGHQKTSAEIAKDTATAAGTTATTAGTEIANAHAANINPTLEQEAQAKATNAHEAARIGIESRKEAREQAIYQQTYGEGANEALRGVEPKLRIPATKAAQSAADEHLKANRTADEMENFISLARQGNKAAYANIPVAGVLEITTSNGVSRINKNELEAFGGAGSLFDKLSGALGKGASGASISKSVLDDIEKMHQSIRNGSDKAYNDKLDAINQNYHAGFKKTPSTRSAGTVRARDPQGVLHEAPAGTALPAGWKEEK